MKHGLLANLGWLSLSALLTVSCAKGDELPNEETPDLAPPALPPWLSSARVLVSGRDVANDDCRTTICTHNENTDLIRWKGAVYLVHRTARSQILGPNSSLWIYRSTDEGHSFQKTAIIAAPTQKLKPLSGEDKARSGRDLRDPHFYVVGDSLHIKALTRLPVVSARDSNVDTITVDVSTKDGENFSPFRVMTPTGYSLWRIKQSGGVYYSAAYQDGDTRVTLFSSPDGVSWSLGSVIYDVATDTPLETELEFLPSGKLLALVRMDGLDDELLGNSGRLRTKVCWASPPYTKFDCDQELLGQRLDGPISLSAQGRLFVLARRHLQPTYKKRTSLFELIGTIDGGPLSWKLWGDLPSAGDTAYAGAVPSSGSRWLVSYYSGDVSEDLGWLPGMLGQSDIWTGVIDIAKLK